MNFFAPSNLPKGRRIAVLVGLALVGIGLAGARGLARPGEPTTTQRRIAQLVSALMERKHLSQMRLDDEISRRALKMFFESLDPMKLYFYQSDVDRFAGEQDKIDDYVRQGDVSLAKRIFDVYLDRVGDRTAVAQELVDARHDFTIDESMDRDPKKIGWIASTEEANERWRKRVKYDLLLETSNDVAEEEAREKLHKRYRSINQRAQQTDDDELLEMFLSAVTMSFDPHSSYMSPRSLSDFIIQMRLELHGIGASLENRFGETVVRHIVPGGPADKDGRLKVEDVIVGVGQGVDGEIVDITDVKLTEVVQQIRGKPDTIVRLDVKTAGGTERKIYDITRARVELKDEEARSQILERGPHGEDMSPQAAAGVASDAQVAGDPNPDFEPPTAEILEKGRGDGTVIRIGVISLPSFYMDMDGRREGRSDYKSTTRDVERLLLEFKRKDVDLVVVDLRFNGGGSLPEAVDTTGLFIDQGPVVQVKGPTGQTLPYLDQTPGAVWTGPLVVLTNRFSASASEIFAGAIQDYGRGIVIGDRSTHGKGTVQQLDELGKVIMPAQPPNYGALKFTILSARRRQHSESRGGVGH